MRIIAIAIAIAIAATASAQKGIAELDIRTSTVCDMCKKRIEGDLIYEKGVKEVSVDLATSTVHVHYDPRKSTPEKLRTALTKLGYAADTLQADPKAFAKLPDCCQKDTGEHGPVE